MTTKGSTYLSQGLQLSKADRHKSSNGLTPGRSSLTTEGPGVQGFLSSVAQDGLSSVAQDGLFSVSTWSNLSILLVDAVVGMWQVWRGERGVRAAHGLELRAEGRDREALTGRWREEALGTKTKR